MTAGLGLVRVEIAPPTTIVLGSLEKFEDFIARCILPHRNPPNFYALKYDHLNEDSSWYNDYLAISPLFSTIELLIPLGAEFNALSPHKL